MVVIPLVPIIFFLAFMDDSGKDLIAGVSNLYLAIGSFVLIVLALLFSIVNWRCPKCKTYLGRKTDPKYCSNCGVELR